MAWVNFTQGHVDLCLQRPSWISGRRIKLIRVDTGKVFGVTKASSVETKGIFEGKPGMMCQRPGVSGDNGMTVNLDENSAIRMPWDDGLYIHQIWEDE